MPAGTLLRWLAIALVWGVNLFVNIAIVGVIILRFVNCKHSILLLLVQHCSSFGAFRNPTDDYGIDNLTIFLNLFRVV